MTPRHPASFFLIWQLALGDGTHGAGASAGAAAHADIGIDDESVFTLGDSLNGALLSARTALHTSISDFVSHVFSLQFNSHIAM